MSGHEFLLPDELGWECNDELQKTIDGWFERAALAVNLAPDANFSYGVMEVAKAELIDDMYAIIKRYQKGKK